VRPEEERAQAASQIQRTLKAWQSASNAPVMRKADEEGIVQRKADEPDEKKSEAKGGDAADDSKKDEKDPNVSQPDEPAEKEADAVADDVADKLHDGDEEKKDGKGGPDEKKQDKKSRGDAGPDEKKDGEKDEKPAAVSAKLEGVGRKIFRAGEGPTKEELSNRLNQLMRRASLKDLYGIVESDINAATDLLNGAQSPDQLAMIKEEIDKIETSLTRKIESLRKLEEESAADGGDAPGMTGGNSRTLCNVEIRGEKWRIDMELPTGATSAGNVHAQKKNGEKKKIFLNSAADVSQLPDYVASNQKIIKAVNRAFDLLAKLKAK
jgi:hypothetical protein